MVRIIGSSDQTPLNKLHRRPTKTTTMNARGSDMNNNEASGGGGQQQQQQPPPHQRKRSRTFSNLSYNNSNNYTPPPFASSTSTTNRGGGSSGSGNNMNNNNSNSSSSKFQLNKHDKLLRLNVGGIPYDVVRTSLPLLETMMTDRWLDGCLLDSEQRIFIDRDGDAFGDILKYLRGGADFLLELVRSSGAASISTATTRNTAVSDASRCYYDTTSSNYYGNHGSGMNYWAGGGGHHHPSTLSSTYPSSSYSNNFFNFHNHSHLSPNNWGDRLRRLRTEADYYGLHQLVHDIDVLTIGQKVVLEKTSWARVAGGCVPPQRRQQQQEQQQHLLGVNDNPMNHPGDPNDIGVPAVAAAHGNGIGDVINNNNGAQNNEVERHNIAMQQNDDDDEEDDHPNEHEDQVMNDEDDEADTEDEEEDENVVDDEDEGEEDDVEEVDDDDDDDDVVHDEEIQFEEEEGLDNIDPTQPLPYKHWSWSKQFGNPDILRPHPTHTSSMIVGQDGTYLLLLRLAAALPSPLARIKWDQEEEEGRRVTRGAALRQRGSLNNNSDANDVNNNDGNPHTFEFSGRSKEVEEDYFVTVNIEAPLQTVMDSVDESQTHFPLLRAGLWDYRTEDEVMHEDPVFATFCAMDVVSLRAGDVLSVSFMNDEVSRERAPFPDNAPPELVNSLTLVKVYGNTLARYERLKSSPNVMNAGMMGNARSARNRMPRAPRYAPEHHQNNIMEEENDGTYRHHHRAEDNTYQTQLDCEAEEFDRSLTRTAHWISPRNDFLPTPFQPPLHSHSSVIEFPHPGHYLVLGRVALGCRRDAQFHSVLSGGPIEGHRAQLSVRSVGGRLLHALGFVFEDKPRLEWADLSILSENCMFNDVVHVPQAGTELSITTTGDCRLHPEGAEVGPFCSRVSQSLSCLLLDDDIMEGNSTTLCVVTCLFRPSLLEQLYCFSTHLPSLVDRYMVGTVRTVSLNKREVKWFHTRSASAPTGRGRGGTMAVPSLFDIDGHRLVWRGCLNNYQMNSRGNNIGAAFNSNTTVLIMGSIPPLHRGYVLCLLKNNDPISISITPESLDMKGR
jgi:hypothetical protein